MINVEVFFSHFGKIDIAKNLIDALKQSDFSQHIHIVNQAELITATDKKPFVSAGFNTCTGYLLRSSDKDTFGLFHVTPWQYLDDVLHEDLMKFVDGEVIQIKGPRSKPRPEIERWLQDNLKLEDIKKIEPSRDHKRRKLTSDENFFSLIFNPDSNEITLLRKNHQQEVFTGFNKK
jgi:hypothetical protein